MYVALTRAERYLFVTSSRPSEYFAARPRSSIPGVANIIQSEGGVAFAAPADIPANIETRASEVSRENRLVTSFSDMRYFLECPMTSTYGRFSDSRQPSIRRSATAEVSTTFSEKSTPILNPGRQSLAIVTS
ncbi:hypothetical protein I552_6784 [Mycobacterium xenopi 3993]|nr:hypothetical protein I552_6784 [Mycobacterium xenopi 3993]